MWKGNWWSNCWAEVREGASRYHRHPERMEINQPRVARNELPWGMNHGMPATLPGLHQPRMAAVSRRARFVRRWQLSPIGSRPILRRMKAMNPLNRKLLLAILAAFGFGLAARRREATALEL